MKKLISMAVALVMALSCMGTGLAAEVSSDGLTVDGWNGWTVTDGSAVTTEDVSRGTVVKVTEGSAERYFAQWFEGVIELSVDVYGEGTISFGDSNGRSAGSVVLANASINGTACSYNANAWNTVKLLVATGTKETEVYLGDTYVTKLTLTNLVRPSKLVVSSDSTIYVDNIKISELMKTAAYADNELTSVYTSDFAANGTNGWTNNNIAEATTLDGESVVSLTKSNGATGNHRFRKALNTEGNLVFEAELLQDGTNPQTSGLTVFLRGKNASTSGGEGRALNILSFDNGYISLGSDKIPSKTFKTEPLYKQGEWFKVKVEVLTENQSMILYVANKNTDGEYGAWVRVNDKPVRFYSSESNVTNNEVHTAFEELVFNLYSGADYEALWYLKSVNLSELATTKTETVFSENFDDADMSLTHYNTEGTETNYLTLTPMMAPATPDGATGTPRHLYGQFHYAKTASNSYYVGEGTKLEAGATPTNGGVTTQKDVNAKQEFFADELDLTDAESVTLSFDYYDAAISRKSTDYSVSSDMLNIGFATADANGTSTFTDDKVSKLALQSGSFTCNGTKTNTAKQLQDWDSVSFTLSPYSAGTNNVSTKFETSGKSAAYAVSTLTKNALQNMNQLRVEVGYWTGGRYYLDNLKVTKEVAISRDEYIKKEYSAYNTFTDAIKRGDVADIALRYVEFEDAEGNVSGIPTAGGMVKSVTIEENSTVDEGTNLVVSVFEGDRFKDTAIIPVEEDKTTYDVNLSTTANSVVKVFIWDMDTLTPLTDAEVINDGTPRTKLVLLGDSIACNYDEDEERRGWGQMLGSYVNTNKLEIVNYASSGASTADFLNTDGMLSDRSEDYNNAINALSPGDYLMISLTRNDADRFGIDEYSANIQTMINDVEKKGATPILVTVHPRCKYIAEHINRFNVGENYYAWVKEMERLAALNNIPVINLFEMAVDSYDTGDVDPATGVNTDIRKLYVGGDDVTNLGDDVTHLSEAGADFAASLIAKGMAQLNCGIEDFVK